MAPPSISPAEGSYYRVQRGETLWRIARDFGWDPQTLAAINKLRNPTHLTPGQQLFIPAAPETNRFLWPVRGNFSAGRSVHRFGGGIQIPAELGALVRASRTGRVAVAAQQLSGWGKTVVLDHGDGYLTVYAGLDQLLVAPGAMVRQSQVLGRTGRDPLHFEIRSGADAQDPLKLLPS